MIAVLLRGVSAVRLALCRFQLHNSLAEGKPPQAGIELVLAPAPPDADAVADPEPLLEPLPPLEPDAPVDP
jgi:hypothetical protein